MNEFVFGTQYLRGCSPRETDWERDLEAVAAAGFNTIRVWLVWGVLEVREGEIDFSCIEKILSIAGKKKLRVIFLFHLHGAPEWMVRKYPHCRYVDCTGRAFEPSARANTPSGGWPGLCPDHPEVQQLEDRFIRSVIAFTGECAYAYEPVNEPHMWVDGAGPQPMEYCYCEATREAFRQWLHRKYGTLDALADAWGRCFDSWESVRPATWAYGYGDRLDFRRFTVENIAALVRRRAETIRDCTSRPVIAHAWGGGSTCCPQLSAMAFDDWRNAGEVELWGCSGFPGDVEATPRLAQSMDATRSAAAGKVFWQSELGCGSIGTGLRFPAPASPELLATWCWESVFHGAKGVLFWQFREEIFGNESGHFGLTERDGSPGKRLAAVSGVAKCLAAHEAEFMAAKPRPAEVALLFSPDSFLLNGVMQNDNSFCCDAVSGYYDAFYRAGIPVDILHADRLATENLRSCRLLILPAGISLSPRQGKRLAEYVRNGGSLLLDPLTASWDEFGRLADALPGGGLAELAGCFPESIREGTGGAFELTAGSSRYLLPEKYTLLTWRPPSAAAVFAVDAQGNPVIVRTCCGTGQVFLSGAALGNLNSRTHVIGDEFRNDERTAVAVGNAAELIADLAGICGIRPRFQAREPLHVHSMLLPEKGELLLVSNLSEKPVTGKVVSALYKDETYTGIYGVPDTEFSPEGEAVFSLPACGSGVLLKK